MDEACSKSALDATEVARPKRTIKWDDKVIEEHDKERGTRLAANFIFYFYVF
jgi:hypothetical protein